MVQIPYAVDQYSYAIYNISKHTNVQSGQVLIVLVGKPAQGRGKNTHLFGKPNDGVVGNAVETGKGIAI